MSAELGHAFDTVRGVDRAHREAGQQRSRPATASTLGPPTTFSRLLMTVDSVGGVWRYALDLAAGLAEKGVTTTLAVLGPPPNPEQRREAAAIGGVTLVDTGLPLDWTANAPADIARAAASIAALAAEQRADIVHLHSAALAAHVAYRQPIVITHHSCVATWWEKVRGGPLPDDFRWRAELLRQGLAAADLVVAPTAAFARITAETYRLRKPPIVVYNGRAPAARRSAAASIDAVFTAGRLWDEGKGVATLDRAAPRMAAKVYAAGPLRGPNGASLDCNHLNSLGELTAAEVRAWLARRPIYVASALYEPFGLAVLEAAQAGCALVLTDIATFRELWDGAAIFVPPLDHDSLADAVNRLLRDPERRTQFQAAAERRSRLYRLDAFVARMFGLYASLAAASPRKEAAA